MLGHSNGLSQASVSRTTTAVTKSLCKLAEQKISFPVAQEQITANKRAFSAIAGFPNVIGAVDCTHVPIKSPSNNEEAYVNRKGVHTINVQAVCDANMRIIDLVAKWPGSTHDSFVWRNSGLHQLFEYGHVPDGWLLGMLNILFSGLSRFLRPGGPAVLGWVREGLPPPTVRVWNFFL